MSTMPNKSFYNILIISGIYVLLPFLYLARYDHPSADDYVYSVNFSKYSLWDIVRQDYFNMSGRYLSRFIYWFDPTRYHSLRDYRIASIIMILLFTATVVFLVRSLTREYLSFRQTLGLCALFIFLYFSKAPGISEAFYWFMSYSIYQLANIFTMLLLIGIVRLRRKDKPSLLNFLGCAVLCIAIMGCNEVSLIITFLFIYYHTISQYFSSKRLDPWLAVLCIVCTLSAIAALAAPGNFTRINGAHQVSRSVAWTMTGSLSISAVYMSQWINPILAASVLYIPLFGAPIAQKMKDSNQSFGVSLKSFVWFFIGVLCFLQVFIIWVAGGSNLGRIYDVIYLFFLLGSFFTLQLILNRNIQLVKKATEYAAPLSLLGLALVISCFLDLDNNVSTAYVDIVAGKANTYDRELTDREKLIRQCQSDSCRVPALSAMPSTIFFTDIRPLSAPSGLWINDAYSKYWNAGFIVPDKAAPEPERNIEALRDLGKQLRHQIMK